MPHEPQQPQGQNWSLDDSFKTTVALGQIVCKPAEMILRVPSTFGRRYLDMQAFLGLFTMLFWVGYHSPVLAVYAFHWLLLWGLVHGVGRRLRRSRTPTQYNGYPWISLVTGLDEGFVKSTAEPALVFVLGCLATDVSSSLASWLVASAAGLATSTGYINMRDAAQLDAAEDARLQQEIFAHHLAERRREPGGGRGVPILRLLILAVVAAFVWAYWPSEGFIPPQQRRDWGP